MKKWIGKNGIRWTAITNYVDIDTGQVLTKKIATDKNKYIKIKTEKYGTVNNVKTRGTIEYTVECRKQPQQKLPFN